MNEVAIVSVVIPVYNIAPHLRRCLDSVLGQTFQEIEVICVDDGSTDESPAILAEYASRDNRISVLTQANSGPGVARNTGLAKATGEYLIFLDSDDWFEPLLLEKMVEQAKNTGADITICKSEEFDTYTGKARPSDWMLKTEYLPGDVFRPEEIADFIFQFTYGWPWDKLYRTKFVRDNNLVYPRLPNSEDLVFVFPSLTVAKRIAVLPEILVHHRINRMVSVSNSRKLAPEAPHKAMALLRAFLVDRDRYKVFERSFLNWAMEFLVWNVSNMGDYAAQRKYYDKLQLEWLPEMNFDQKKREYYYDKKTYKKYRLAKQMPYPAFKNIVLAYKRWKQIVSR